MIDAHAKRDDAAAPGQGAAWLRVGEILREARTTLDDLSHANPARIKFVLAARGYDLYPIFDRDARMATTWFGLVGLSQMLFFTRKRLDHYGKTVPNCNTDDLHGRIEALLKELDAYPSEAPAATERSGSKATP